MAIEGLLSDVDNASASFCIYQEKDVGLGPDDQWQHDLARTFGMNNGMLSPSVAFSPNESPTCSRECSPGASPARPTQQQGVQPMSIRELWGLQTQRTATVISESTLASSVITGGGSTTNGSLLHVLGTSPGSSPGQRAAHAAFSPDPAGASEAGSIEDSIAHTAETIQTSSMFAFNSSGGSQVDLGLGGWDADLNQLLAQPERLSHAQAYALPKVRFEAPERQRCSICLEHFSHGMLLTGLTCGHAFHVDCLSQWVVQHSAHCPNCRTAVRPLRV